MKLYEMGMRRLQIEDEIKLANCKCNGGEVYISVERKQALF